MVSFIVTATLLVSFNLADSFSRSYAPLTRQFNLKASDYLSSLENSAPKAVGASVTEGKKYSALYYNHLTQDYQIKSFETLLQEC